MCTVEEGVVDQVEAATQYQQTCHASQSSSRVGCSSTAAGKSVRISVLRPPLHPCCMRDIPLTLLLHPLHHLLDVFPWVAHFVYLFRSPVTDLVSSSALKLNGLRVYVAVLAVDDPRMSSLKHPHRRRRRHLGEKTGITSRKCKCDQATPHRMSHTPRTPDASMPMRGKVHLDG